MNSCSWFGHHLARFAVAGEKETAECGVCGRELYFLHTTSSKGERRTTTQVIGERPDSWPSLDTPRPAVATPAEVTGDAALWRCVEALRDLPMDDAEAMDFLRVALRDAADELDHRNWNTRTGYEK